VTRTALIIIIGSILVLLSIILCYALVRRSKRKRMYGQLDSERARFAPLVAGLVAGGGVLEPLLKATAPLERAAIEALLFKAIEEPGADRERVAKVFEELGYVRRYVNDLRNGTRWVRAGAAEKLGRIRCRRVAPYLVKGLESEYADVCNTAAHSLGAIGDEKAIPHIMDRLVRAIEGREEVSIRILKSSIIAFGPDALEYLLGRLDSSSWKVRAAAVDMIGEMEGPRAVRALTAALADSERDVRAKAAKGLGKLRDPSSALPLIEAMEDAHWVVRLHATRSSAMVRDPAAVEHVARRLNDINWQVRKVAAEALGAFSGSAFVILLDVYLNGHDKYSKEQASDEISRSGALTAIAAAVLEKDTPGPHDIFTILNRVRTFCHTYKSISPDDFLEILVLLSGAGRDEFARALEQFSAGALGPGQIEEVVRVVDGLVHEHISASAKGA